MSVVFNPFTGNFDEVSDLSVTVGSSSNANASTVTQAGTSIALTLQPANTSFPGVLTAADWNTFNSKQPAGNYITALTGDGTASGPGSAALTLATVNSNVGSFGTASATGTFTVNAKGLITAASSTSIQIAESQVTNLVSDLAGKQPTGNYITALTGDATASGPGSAALTLATVNSNVGSFTYGSFTVNAKGLITAASSGTAPVTSVAMTVPSFLSVAGSPITSTGTLAVTLSGTALPVANGGTGQTSYTDGQLLIGNTTGNTLAKSTLTAGSGISITNGSGTITIASTASAPVLAAPTSQSFTSGSGTYNKNYTFVITSGSATIGATYTNNSITYTVYATVASATQVVMSGSGAPTASGTLTKASGTGDSTLTFSQVLAPLYLRVRMAGGGGGGSGSGTNAGTSATAGSNTTFGSSLLTANGGSPGIWNAVGASGGGFTINSPAAGIGLFGGSGQTFMGFGTTTLAVPGAVGGANPLFGGSATAGNYTGGGVNGYVNTGGGGQGGGNNAVINADSGTGGGSGGAIDAIIPNPSATYAYAVGAGGSGGGAGTSGSVGGGGGSGVVYITEYYQ